MIFKLWSEGYAITGGHGSATYEGEVEAENLYEAKLTLLRQRYGPKPLPQHLLDNPTVWGCRLFDNEEDARKSFG